MATLWHSRAQQLLALRERAEMGGGARRMEKQKAAGKLGARERLELLFDAGTFVASWLKPESMISAWMPGACRATAS